LRKALLASLLAFGAVLVAAAMVMLHGPAAPVVAAQSSSAPAAAKLGRAAPAEAGTPPSAAAAVKHTARTSVPAQAAPVWTLDKAASRLTFRAVMNGQPFDGVFRTWDAQIAFDPHNLATSRATITVDTTSALTGQPIKDAALPNSEWLSSTAFPQATLVTRTLSEVSPGHYEASADVHIRGVAWRTTVPFTVSINHDEGRMQSTLTLDRRTFGIGEGPFRSPAPVEPMVQVSLRLMAKKTK
jgi:polyisoprenoid-binding protein YceI